MLVIADLTLVQDWQTLMGYFWYLELLVKPLICLKSYEPTYISKQMGCISSVITMKYSPFAIKKARPWRAADIEGEDYATSDKQLQGQQNVPQKPISDPSRDY